MKKDQFRHIIILLLLLPAFPAMAQVMMPSAKMNRSEMLIGHQAEVVLSVELNLQNQWPAIDFPYKQDEWTEGVEILETTPVDTTQPDPNNAQLYQLSQRYTITSFDSGMYDLGRLPVVVNGDSLFSNALQLAVNTVQIDTTQTAIFDIKEIYEVELTWKDYFDLYGWIVLLISLAGAIAMLAFFFIRNRRRKAAMVAAAPKPIVPSHIIALDALRKLEEEKAWQSRPLKIYHTDLTDIIREYIEGRYRVPAHEQTSNEVLQNLRFADLREDATLRLRHVLKLADMVKFAKEQPGEQENERSFMYAREFVVMTQPIEQPDPETSNNEGQQPDNEQV